jgi:DNA-binding NarL/FixJ family response regulator
MTAKRQISLLMVDDHLIVREGLCALLSLNEKFCVVGQAENGREAVAMAKSLQPDVILMDIAMPLLNGLEAARQILTTNPAGKIIIVSAHTDDAYIQHLSSIGVAGFVEKQASFGVLTNAILEVAKGNSYFSPFILKRLRGRAIKPSDWKSAGKSARPKLSAREAEVLQLVAEGAANKQIADALHISVKTVEKHRQHLMRKLDIHDTATLTRYAIATGSIESAVQLTII